jgi:endonuclease G, mitochondrial
MRDRPVIAFNRLLFAALVLFPGALLSQTPTNGVEGPAAGIQECTPELVETHNPGIVAPSGQLVCFEAYVSNFADAASKTPDGKPLGVPLWVSHKVAKAAPSAESRARPRHWFTVPQLHEEGLAPTDESYSFSQRYRARHRDWFERGHLAPKYLAERIGERAAWFTHSVANAVPQRSRFNKRPWFALECLTGAWANHYGALWVVSGPVFLEGSPARWLKSDIYPGALPVAIPDELFKLVARRTDSWQTLAFILPQEDESYTDRSWDFRANLISIERLQLLSGQQIFPNPLDAATRLGNINPVTLWPVRREEFDPACRSFARNIP